MLDKKCWETLKVLVEDEVLLLKYDSSFNHLNTIKDIRLFWESERNIVSFHRWLTKEFSKLKPSFVSAISEKKAVNENYDQDYETLIFKFYTLTVVLLKLIDTDDSSQKLNYPLLMKDKKSSKKVKYVISQCIELLLFKEFPNLKLAFEKTNLPYFLKEWFEDFNRVFENFNHIFVLDSAAEILDEIYVIYNFITDFFDYLDESELEVLDEEIENVNYALYTILYLHCMIYNIVLIIEKVFEYDEEEMNIELIPLKEVLEEHDAHLEMMRLLSAEWTN